MLFVWRIFLFSELNVLHLQQHPRPIFTEFAYMASANSLTKYRYMQLEFVENQHQ